MTQADGKTSPTTIVCAADDNYVPGLAVTLFSALRHCSANAIEVVIVDSGLKASSKRKIALMIERLETASAAPVSIRWITLDDALDDIPLVRHFSKAVYVRVLLCDLIADRDRCIYLDCDLLVQDDLTKIWQLDLAGNLLAASPERIGPKVAEYMTGFLGVSAADLSYFNSGVLLIDLHRFRETGSAKTTIEFCRQHAGILRCADQDGLNVTCAGKWYELPAKWNQTLKVNHPCPDINSGILHFIFAKKPWSVDFRARDQQIQVAHEAYVTCLFETGILPMHRRFLMRLYRKFWPRRIPA